MQDPRGSETSFPPRTAGSSSGGNRRDLPHQKGTKQQLIPSQISSIENGSGKQRDSPPLPWNLLGFLPPLPIPQLKLSPPFAAVVGPLDVSKHDAMAAKNGAGLVRPSILPQTYHSLLLGAVGAVGGGGGFKETVGRHPREARDLGRARNPRPAGLAGRASAILGSWLDWAGLQEAQRHPSSACQFGD